MRREGGAGGKGTVRASDGAGRRRGRRANPEGAAAAAAAARGRGERGFRQLVTRADAEPAGIPGDVSSRRGARTRHRSWGSSGPNYREARERRVCDGACRRGEGEGGQGRAVGDAPGEGGGRMGGRPSPSPHPPPGGPEKKYDRDGAPPGGRRDCCSAGAWGLRPDATRLSARDGAIRHRAAAPRRRRGVRTPGAGRRSRGRGATRTRRDRRRRRGALCGSARNAALSRPVSRAGAGRGAAAHLPQL